jgi:hypothetical protein
MSTQVIELEGFEIELASELYCDVAEITANWLIVRVRIAGGLATTSMNRQCCAYGAGKQSR